MSGAMQQLLPRHYKIIDLFLDGSWNNMEIAEKVGVTPVTVKNVLAMPATQDIIAKRRKTKTEIKDTVSARLELDQVDIARKKLNDAATQAAETLIESLFSEDDKLRNKGANDILDRIGIARVAKNENTNKSAVLVLDADTAERIMSTLILDNG